MSLGCICGHTSGCKTNLCSCKKNNKSCDSNCKCKPLICTLREIKDNESNQEDNPINFKILKQLFSVSCSNKHSEVFEFRNGFDIYTEHKEEEIKDPDLDHIIENQMLTYASLKPLSKTSIVQPYIEPLKKAINLNENYNVTHGSLNKSKGSIIKSYLNDKINDGLPLGAVVLQKKNPTYFRSYVNNILDAMHESSIVVLDNVREAKRNDNNVSGSKVFDEIGDELEKLFKTMDLDRDSEQIVTRSRSQN